MTRKGNIEHNTLSFYLVRVTHGEGEGEVAHLHAISGSSQVTQLTVNQLLGQYSILNDNQDG